MNFEKIYIDGINNLLNDDFHNDPISLSKFLNQNKNLIFNLLNNKSVVDQTVNVINYLIKKNKIYLSIIYHEILSSKFHEDYELKFQLANSCANIKLYKIAEIHLLSIPKNKLKPQYVKLLINIYHKLQDFINCIKYIEYIRKTEGADEIGTRMLIDCYRRLGNLEKAEEYFKQLNSFTVNELNKSILSIQINLAKGKFELAKNEIKKNILNFPKKPELRELKALINFKYKEFDDAIIELNEAKELGYDDYDSAVYDCFLSSKNFKDGFNSLVKATKNNIINNYFISKNLDQWSGENLNNHNLFIYPGEGIALGDQIFFFRYLSDLIKKFEKIKIYLCLTSLKSKNLFSYKNIEVILIDDVERYINTLGTGYYSSLPGLAKVYENFKSEKKMPLHFDFVPHNEQKSIFWKNYIKNYSSKLNVGLNWKGDLKYKWDIYRSLNVKYLDEILNINQIQFFILNINLSFEEKNYLKNFNNIKILDDKLVEAEQKNSFIETVEIMRNLDLVISTDTSIAHIASAIGVKLYLLLEHSPFWYWNTTEVENYYQNNQITFFKQPVPGDWFSVINNLKNKLLN